MAMTTIARAEHRIVNYAHPCTQCGRVFQRRSALRRHITGIHEKRKDFGCQFCSHKFTRSDLLQRHVSLYHKSASRLYSETTRSPVVPSTSSDGRAIPTSPVHPVSFDNHFDAYTVDQRPLSTPLPLLDETQQANFLSSGRDQTKEPSMPARQGQQHVPATMAPSEGSDAYSKPEQSHSIGVATAAGSISSSSASSSCIVTDFLNDLFSFPSNSALVPSTNQSHQDEMMPDEQALPRCNEERMCHHTKFDLPSAQQMHPTSLLQSSSGSDCNPCVDTTHLTSSFAQSPLDLRESLRLIQQSCLTQNNSVDYIGTTPSYNDDDKSREEVGNSVAHDRVTELYAHYFDHHFAFVHFPTLDISQEAASTQTPSLYDAMMAILRQYAGPSSRDPTSETTSAKGRSPLRPSIVGTQRRRSYHRPHSISRAQQVGHASLTLVRRAQALAITHLVTLFGKDDMQDEFRVKLSYGSLMVIARELLTEFNSFERLQGMPETQAAWLQWSLQEEAVRTLWTLYLIDIMHAMRFQRQQWLPLCAFARVPDVCSDSLWYAPDAESFFMLLRQQSLPTCLKQPIVLADFVMDLRKPLASVSQQVVDFGPYPSPLGMTIAVATLAMELVNHRLQDTESERQSPVSTVTQKDGNTLLCMPCHGQSFQTNCANREHKSELDTAFVAILHRWLHANHNRHLARPIPSSFQPLSSEKVAWDADSKLESFSRNAMPWYWFALHQLGTLRRPAGLAWEKAHRPILPISKQTVSPSMAHTVHSVNLSADDKLGEDLSLIVRLRYMLKAPDRGAFIQIFIGKPELEQLLPPVESNINPFSFIFASTTN